MAKDITGQRFGRLTAVKLDHKSKHGADYWQFQCDCGRTIVRGIETMKRGKTDRCDLCKGLPYVTEEERKEYFAELNEVVRRRLFGG